MENIGYSVSDPPEPSGRTAASIPRREPFVGILGASRRPFTTVLLHERGEIVGHRIVANLRPFHSLAGLLPRRLVVCHISKLPCRELPIDLADVVQQRARILIVKVEVHIRGRGNRAVSATLVRLVQGRYDRAMSPSLDRLAKQGLGSWPCHTFPVPSLDRLAKQGHAVIQGEVKSLRVVAQLLKFKIGNGLTGVLGLRREKIPGDIIGGQHG